jgi:hypothetical protein
MREFYGDLLEQEGIPAILKTTSLARYATSPVIDIWVRLRDLEAAKQVIEPALGDERPAHAEKRPG